MGNVLTLIYLLGRIDLDKIEAESRNDLASISSILKCQSNILY